MRAACADHRGVEFKSEGDALLIAFGSARDGLAAAVDAQARLRAEAWPDDGVIRVRMGLHTGIAFPRDGDYIALALHQAAHVVGAGNGGQVIASAETIVAAGEVEGLRTERVGAYRLRDFDAPAELYQVTAVDTPGEPFPPLRAVPAEGHNLSRPTDMFVGRADEVVQLAELVQPGRLVSLVGPGGMGKTRLSLEFALDVASEWSDGVWMVDLVTVAPGEPITGAVAEVLGVNPGSEDLDEAIVDHLRSRRALVVLDNCEHVVHGARQLASRVLAGATDTAVLATSRTRLGVPGEHTMLVTPLPVSLECVDLFVDRARRQGTGAPAAEDHAVVLEICRRLDGMPLAIELAAARSNVLTPGEILDSIRDRLASLRRRDDAVHERQRTLQGLIDWSYELLDPMDQAVFRRLSVFVGSFDLATAVAAVSHDGVDADDVTEIVWSLTDKSLVNVERREGSTRYRLLETIRAVAGGYCEDAGDAVSTRAALGERYLAVFPFADRGNRTWRARLRLEQATLVQLIDHLIDDGAVEVGHALARLNLENHLGEQSTAEAIRMLLRVIDASRPVSRGSVRLESAAAKLLAEGGDPAGAAAHLASCRRHVEQFGAEDRFGPVFPSRAYSQLCLRDGSEEALRSAEEAVLADLGRPGSLMERGDLLVDLAMVRTALGEEGSVEILREVAAVAEELDDHVAQMTALNNLAETELREGDIARAAEHQRAAMRLSAELGVPVFSGFGLILAARIAQLLGLDEMTVRMHAAADVLLEECAFQLNVDDRALSDAALRAARDRLGARYEVEETAGRAMALTDALAVAEDVFDQAGARPTS